jgi:threonyl-tRNA synthetase
VKLENYDIRASVDESNEKVGKKIREAELAKVPYMLVVGEEEERSGDLSVRKKGEGDLGKFSVEAFAKLVTEEISQMLA